MTLEIKVSDKNTLIPLALEIYANRLYRKQEIASKLFLETAKVYRIGQNIINFGKSAAAKKLKRRFKIPGTFREYWKLKASGKNIFDPPV